MSKASKLALMLFMGLLLAGKAHVQEVKHAPTIEQCRADQRLWLDKLESTEPMPEGYHTMRGWSHEMTDCESVDPENRRLYSTVTREVTAGLANRLLDFIDRHGLFDKFIEEDKAGKR